MNVLYLNFNATKSFCVAFTPKHYKLSLPPLFMNISPIMYIDSIKYLGFTFTSNHCDDAECRYFETDEDVVLQI